MKKPSAKPKKSHIINTPSNLETSFFKRPAELSRFVQSIRFNKSEILPPITGPVGSGKRTLALQFIQEYQHYYDFIFWIPAAAQRELSLAYQKIAKTLNIDTPSHSLSALTASIQTQLSHCQSLYIFNEATSFTVIQPYLPGHGHTIVISPNSSPTAWPRHPFHIASLSQEEISQLFAYYGKDSLISTQAFRSFLPLMPPYPMAVVYTLKLMKCHNFTLEGLLATIKAKPELFWALSKNAEACSHYYQFIRHLLDLFSAKNRSPSK
ncbi:MAG: hypothetical protein AAF443_01145 [Chlamydiota bacterium]